jgi:uncharacterized protein YukJ
MPLKRYGIWVAYPISYEAERGSKDSTPHIHLYYDVNKDATQGENRASINVKSGGKESRLVYWLYRNFTHPITDELKKLSLGLNEPPKVDIPRLDYIRGNLMDFVDGTILAHDVPGEKNDIIDFVSPVLDQAIAENAKIFLFGEPFKDTTGDMLSGIHDVHINQGSDPPFAKYNGVNQDGGLIIEFKDGHFEALFLAFASGKTHTDDDDGMPIGTEDFVTLLGAHMPPPDTKPKPAPTPDKTKPAPAGSVYIKAAKITGKETVYLHNRTSHVVDLHGWALVNRQNQAQKLNGILRPFADIALPVPDCPLSNRGGTISLLDPNGLKVGGVSYTAAQIRREGSLLYFQ